MIHSLDSFSFLKLDSCNFLYFKCTNETDKVVCVQQEQVRVTNQIDSKDENIYDPVYNISIKEPTLRQLMIIYSLYLCDSPA